MTRGGQSRRTCGRIDKSCIRTIHGCAQGARIGIGEIDAIEIGARIKERRRPGHVYRAGIRDVDRTASRAGPEGSESKRTRNGGNRTSTRSSRERANGLGIGSAREAQDSTCRLRQRVRSEDDGSGVR